MVTQGEEADDVGVAGAEEGVEFVAEGADEALVAAMDFHKEGPQCAYPLT